MSGPSRFVDNPISFVHGGIPSAKCLEINRSNQTMAISMGRRMKIYLIGLTYLHFNSWCQQQSSHLRTKCLFSRDNSLPSFLFLVRLLPTSIHGYELHLSSCRRDQTWTQKPRPLTTIHKVHNYSPVRSTHVNKDKSSEINESYKSRRRDRNRHDLRTSQSKQLKDVETALQPTIINENKVNPVKSERQ